MALALTSPSSVAFWEFPKPWVSSSSEAVQLSARPRHKREKTPPPADAAGGTPATAAPAGLLPPSDPAAAASVVAPHGSAADHRRAAALSRQHPFRFPSLAPSAVDGPAGYEKSRSLFCAAERRLTPLLRSDRAPAQGF